MSIPEWKQDLYERYKPYLDDLNTRLKAERAAERKARKAKKRALKTLRAENRRNKKQAEERARNNREIKAEALWKAVAKARREAAAARKETATTKRLRPWIRFVSGGGANGTGKRG